MPRKQTFFENFFLFIKNDTVFSRVYASVIIFTVVTLGMAIFDSPLKENNIDAKSNLVNVQSEIYKRRLEQEQQNYIDALARFDSIRIKYNKLNLDTSINRQISSSQIGQLKIDIDSLERRFAKIENIIVKDPIEALEMPLLKREIEDVKLYNQARFDSLSKDIERAYNMIIASLVSLAIAIFAPALSSVFQKKRTELDKKSDDSNNDKLPKID